MEAGWKHSLEGADNAAFSVPEIQDLRARVKTLSALASEGQPTTVLHSEVKLGLYRPLYLARVSELSSVGTQQERKTSSLARL